MVKHARRIFMFLKTKTPGAPEAQERRKGSDGEEGNILLRILRFLVPYTCRIYYVARNCVLFDQSRYLLNFTQCSDIGRHVVKALTLKKFCVSYDSHNKHCQLCNGVSVFTVM
jgi:hypothetical protein